jgi:hypothetical protein
MNTPPNPTHERIIARIRKMLTLAQDGAATEGEIENAMRLARQLLDEHNLTEQDVAPPPGASAHASAGIQQAPSRFRTGWGRWREMLALAAGKLTDCGVVFHTRPDKRQCAIFVGTSLDTTIALEMFAYLETTAKTLARQHYGPGKWKPAHRQYALGFANTCFSRASRATETSSAAAGTTAIVVRKAEMVKSYIREEMRSRTTRMTKARIKHPDAYVRGCEDGKRIDLSTSHRIA